MNCFITLKLNKAFPQLAKHARVVSHDSILLRIYSISSPSSLCFVQLDLEHHILTTQTSVRNWFFAPRLRRIGSQKFDRLAPR